MLSVSYIGALGRELPNYINVNLDPTKTYTATYTVAPATGSCGPAACGTYNVLTYAGRQCTTLACSSTTNILKNPTFSSITESSSNINSDYHALTVDVTNRSRSGSSTTRTTLVARAGLQPERCNGTQHQ